ncbi:hypothetical protein CIPAW_16G066500 [Carya illinoinensis]|uniref:Uncharacterized protein n=1 Tax=Carya illinoinensis TaxID=32201 RepID=A0A8T1N288_CARIL|nr:hypothetical protein CIPAW_16G066500 [Carya illinoinensis]KAG6625016.1 hypothetical protein CIPAW_16G066500 [Carya illinoinensis]
MELPPVQVKEDGVCVKMLSAPLNPADSNTLKERLNRSLMACQYKFEAAKLQKKLSGLHELESCVDQSTKDNIKMLPHIAGKLKATFSSVIRENSHLIF